MEPPWVHHTQRMPGFPRGEAKHPSSIPRASLERPSSVPQASRLLRASSLCKDGSAPAFPIAHPTVHIPWDGHPGREPSPQGPAAREGAEGRGAGEKRGKGWRRSRDLSPGPEQGEFPLPEVTLPSCIRTGPAAVSSGS